MSCSFMLHRLLLNYFLREIKVIQVKDQNVRLSIPYDMHRRQDHS